jgi:hypothetical protein
MENLSRPVRNVKIPLTVAIPDYLRDHRYDGRIVLPAAEALQILAKSLPDDPPGCDIRLQERGEFTHLLPLDAGADTFSAFHEIVFSPDGRRLSRLTTLRSGRQTQWTRSIEHVSVSFLPFGENRDSSLFSKTKIGSCPYFPHFPLRRQGAPKNLKCALQKSAPHATPAQTGTVGREGPSFFFPCRRLYADLVPFGSAYHNVVGEVSLTRVAASATVSGGDLREAVGPLGSPFPIDAAMHVACAWGQRYRNVVAFPVGFDRREIVLPTSAGETYRCRVFPLGEEGAVLRFNIWLLGKDDRPAEVILGLRMRDISGGRLKPPAWVRKGV